MGGRQSSGLTVVADTDWMTLGVCSPEHTPRHHPNIWFPTDGVGVSYAKRLCDTCPVQVECLEYALANRVEHGVWGGESERSRRRLLREVWGVDISTRQGIADVAEV